MSQFCDVWEMPGNVYHLEHFPACAACVKYVQMYSAS